MSREDKSVHIIITGSRQAGISSFISQMENDREKVDEIGMGIDIQSTSLFLNGSEIFVFFYEIAGPFPIDSLTKILRKKNLGLAVMFDLSNTVSFEMADMLYRQVAEKIGDRMPKFRFLLGSHLDLERDVNQDSIDALLDFMGPDAAYREFSAKSKENLVETMEYVVRTILEQEG
jgi:hypothetical protein